MSLFQRIAEKWKFRRHPQKDLLTDYNTLIKLARRCAYDLRHTVDNIPRDHYYIKEFGFEKRARYWVDLFAKGNPGKDYRHEMHLEMARLENKLEQIAAWAKENNVKIPAHLLPDDDIPF